MKHRLLRDAAWSWFADPRAVRSGEITFVGYVTRRGHVEVAALRGGDITTHRLRARLARNDHAAPALLVRPDGRVVAFYSAHNGPAMLATVATRPHDITAWGPEVTIGSGLAGDRGHTYPQPIQVADSIVLIWRGPSWDPVMASSDDGGTTWSPPQTLITASDRPYLKVVGDGESIHIGYTDGHPHHAATNRLWYLRWSGGRFARPDGSPVRGDPPLPVEAGDLVDDGGRNWIWDIAARGDGTAVIVFSTVSDQRSHRYRYAAFDEGRWVVHDLGDAGGSIQGDDEWAYSAGIALDHDAPETVYLIRRNDAGARLERMTLDGGSWTSTRLARGRRGREDLRPVVVRGHGGRRPIVLWLGGRYDHYREYDLRLLGWPPRRTDAGHD